MRKQKREPNQRDNDPCPSNEAIHYAQTVMRERRGRQEKPPRRFLELVLAIDAVAKQPEALEVFRKHILDVASERANILKDTGVSPPDFLGCGELLSPAQEYTYLGTFHDTFNKRPRRPIMPADEWQRGDDGDCHTAKEQLARSLPGGMYEALGVPFLDACKVPDNSQEIDDLYCYLDNVKADLAARALPPLEDVKAAEQDEESADKTTREPSPLAMQAYRLHVLSEITQTEIAAMLSRESKRPISQGQVSKWVTEVREYVEAGNVLPDLGASGPKGNLRYADPAKLDYQENPDGRFQPRKSPLQYDGDDDE